MMSNIVSELERLGQKYSMSHWGLCPLEKPQSIDFYRTWINNNHHGEMKYLADHLDMKESPKKYWPTAESALVFAKSYFPFPENHIAPAKTETRTALYSQGEDYHHWFKQELQSLSQELQLNYPDADFLAMTDSSPVLERDLAARAGLGWVGKNTCLIHPKKGSLFFLGEIYTSLKITSKPEPIPDFCGSCNRCLDICPTGALTEPQHLDATKCISYWTIESKNIPPENLRDQFGDWFFGCDLCQTVCPWNQKIFKTTLQTELTRTTFHRDGLIAELREILSLSGKKLQRKFLGSALQRAGAFGLRRNAILVATNLRFKELTPDIEKLIVEPRLISLVEWSLQILKS